MSTEVEILSGHTVMLAGLIRENVEKTKDGIPLLEQNPLLQALSGFQGVTNDGEVVMVFVKASFQDPTGGLIK